MDLWKAFMDLTDLWTGRNRRHLLEDILILTVHAFAFICNASTWTEVENFGHAKHHWLKTFLALPNDIPSHDTLGQVFARLNPEGFH